MKRRRKVVLAVLLAALLALVAVPVLARRDYPVQPFPYETRTLYGTHENPLGWGRVETPFFSDYAYVRVRSDLTSLTTGTRQVRCNPCYVYRGYSVPLHWEDVGEGRPWCYMFHVLTHYRPEVFLGHIPDDYYTGFVEITWVR